MDAQQHKEFNGKAQGALNQVCAFLRENGHDIDTEPNVLGQQLDIIQKALYRYRYLIDMLEAIQSKLNNFFRKDEQQM